MTTILVGVDGSDRSRDAIAFTRDIADASGAAVVVANAFPYEDRPSRMANVGFRHVLEGDAEKVVAAMRAPLADLGPERLRSVIAPRTSPAHALQELAEAERAALIVVGSSHVGAAGRVMPGSTAERLLHGAPCPVAVVPRGYRERPAALRRIGVAFDGSPEATAALHAGTVLARAAGAELSVIRSLHDVDDELRAELDAVVGRLPAELSAQAVLETGDPVAALVARSSGLDLLVTGSRGYGPLRAVLAGGVTGPLLRDAACPILVVPRGVDTPLDELFAAGAEARA